MRIPDNGCRSGGKPASKDVHTHARIWPTCKVRSAIRVPVGRATKPVFCTLRSCGLAKTFAEPISPEPSNRFVADVILDFLLPAGT